MVTVQSLKFSVHDNIHFFTQTDQLLTASLGVFQITGANTNEEFSAGGSFNTSSRQKKARITMRVEYRIK